MIEQIAILDALGQDTLQQCSKEKAHRYGFFHATAHLWLYTEDKKILWQKRSFSKSNFPGLWDVSVAGHITAGESPLAAILRETKEELGLELNADQLTFIGRIKEIHQHSPVFIDSEFHYIYIAELPIAISALTLQKEEVHSIELRPLDTLKNAWEKLGYVPHKTAYYQWVWHHLNNSLRTSTL